MLGSQVVLEILVITRRDLPRRTNSRSCFRTRFGGESFRVIVLVSPVRSDHPDPRKASGQPKSHELVLFYFPGLSGIREKSAEEFFLE